MATQKEHSAKWYAANRSTQMARVKATQLRNAEFVTRIKEATGCCRCDETDPACLDFHHRVPADKKFAIFAGARNGRSLAALQEEIDKCDVLCANCHRKLHAAEAKKDVAPAL